jgi:serine protease Do
VATAAALSAALLLAVATVGLVVSRAAARENEKNDASVKAAFRETVAPAAAATVRVLSDGRPVALGTIVDADGYVITKASLMDDKLVCRLRDGRELPAEVVGRDDEHDLALLRVGAKGLPTAAWRAEPPPVGSLVAAAAAEGDPLAVGVVSCEPRKIAEMGRRSRPQGWLGVGLGGEDESVFVQSLTPGSAADKAGLKVGDRIKSIDGKAVRSVNEVVATVGSHVPGRKIVLLILREDKEQQIAATLGRPQSSAGPQDHWGGGPFSDRRTGFPVALPHDLVIRPDDCGGPLVDTDGRIVGVNIARALRVSSFAIPAATVQKVVADLKRRGAK